MSIAEQSCAQAPSVAILRQKKLSATSVGANSVRPCSEFAIILNCRCGGIVITSTEQCNNQGLLLRQANSVRPYTYIVQISQVQQNTPYRNFDRSTFMAKSSYHDRSQPCLFLGFAAVFLFESLSSQPEIMRYGSVQCLSLVNSH